MPMMRKRALRRHHTSRLKQKTCRVFKWWGFAQEGLSAEEKGCVVNRFYNNLTKCSCDWCCNPRKHGEKTVQERKADLYDLDEDNYGM